jgi:hypothetical protein
MKRIAVLTALVAVAAAVSAGVAIARTGSDSADRPITGAALTRASEAALAETGGGRVTGTEIGDEDSYYEVEVTLDDGAQVDVQLDKGFDVVGSTPDTERPGDQGGDQER